MQLPDIQQSKDTRNIFINAVGTSDMKFPLDIPLKAGGVCSTVAQVDMLVSLSEEKKGVHMSRFAITLNNHPNKFGPQYLQPLLQELLVQQDAQYAKIKMKFPIFLRREAPVTKFGGLVDYDCIVTAVATKDSFECILGVGVLVKTLCPCSKEISDYGAHNQRSLVTIMVRDPQTERKLWFEDLIKIAANSGSAQLYSILKRPDEKYVTEEAYNNPRFVEDVVREAKLKLNKEFPQLSWYFISSRNQESIHNHNAYGEIVHGDLGPLASFLGDL